MKFLSIILIVLILSVQCTTMLHQVINNNCKTLSCSSFFLWFSIWACCSLNLRSFIFSCSCFSLDLIDTFKINEYYQTKLNCSMVDNRKKILNSAFYSILRELEDKLISTYLSSRSSSFFFFISSCRLFTAVAKSEAVCSSSSSSLPIPWRRNTVR